MSRGLYFFIIQALGLIRLLITCWWRDVVRESAYQGYHTLRVLKGIKIGFILFILSEVAFFFRFFWGFFEFSLSPLIELGGKWPPIGITQLDRLGIPLLNTAILLSSGAFLTLGHNFLIMGKKLIRILLIRSCVALGALFSILQVKEYVSSSFSLNDSRFGTSFFVITGFHGLHVLFGTIFLVVTVIRLIWDHFSFSHHRGLEIAAWYWHFVDVVWIFLFTFIYLWAMF